MRHHYERPEFYQSMYGEIYICDHPVYNRCTLYMIGEKGLAVIQQRYDNKTKATRWEQIDPWLTDEIYLHPKFKSYFDKRSGVCENGCYPTVTVRQIMWALRMKPLPKPVWETVFDRRSI